ncbi:MAG: type III pantothenate kinase [Candidatus Dadabacteria bacterium]|nr:type III pantothenate kinase [Candidatus Dadabacteria bacterium]NIQ12851.1 type III pantothenate kinase [Candidatus Dadabacteria bacterium]
MLIVIDIGNSNIVFGVFENDNLFQNIRFETDKNKDYEETSKFFLDILKEYNINASLVKGAIISSVVPSLTAIFKKIINSILSIEPVIVSNNIITNMPLLIDNPEELGADRIVNAVGAYEKIKKSLIVVDFGTATTFDCVSERGEYLGGIIAPGITLSSKALSAEASKLPKVELLKPKNLIGKNTIECMQSGLVYGYAVMIDGLVSKLIDEMKSDPYIIATGGLANLIVSETENIFHIDNNLTINGLKILYEFNS